MHIVLRLRLDRALIERRIIELWARPAGLIYRRLPVRKAVHLTFDDGPDPVATPPILAALREFDTKATFFVLGQNCQRYPDLIDAIVADGHDIGIHGWAHTLWPGRSQDSVQREWLRVRGVLPDRVRDTPLIRPPGGDFSFAGVCAARRAGCRLFLWDVDPSDYLATISPEILVERVLSTVDQGSIILLHDVPVTGEALPDLLRNLRLRGLETRKLNDSLSALPSWVRDVSFRRKRSRRLKQ